MHGALATEQFLPWYIQNECIRLLLCTSTSWTASHIRVEAVFPSVTSMIDRNVKGTRHWGFSMLDYVENFSVISVCFLFICQELDSWLAIFILLYQVALPYPEPLVHFALVCGTQSGPALQCYSPGNIDKELMDAARNFLRNGGIIVDMNAKVASASKILKW